jgi:hypothetical protein
LDVLFLARYALPYNERSSVVYFEERPCFLIGERVEGLAMKAGPATREHYSYTKSGSETFPAAEAFALGQHFAFCPTPKSGSWLNRIEIEFSALAKQCLHGRLPTQQQLNMEIQALVAGRQQKGIQIHWQFFLESARSEFSRHYQQVNAENTTCCKA